MPRRLEVLLLRNESTKRTDSDGLAATAASAHVGHGGEAGGQRGHVRWLIAVARDGSISGSSRATTTTTGTIWSIRSASATARPSIPRTAWSATTSTRSIRSTSATTWSPWSTTTAGAVATKAGRTKSTATTTQIRRQQARRHATHHAIHSAAQTAGRGRAARGRVLLGLFIGVDTFLLGGLGVALGHVGFTGHAGVDHPSHQRERFVGRRDGSEGGSHLNAHGDERLGIARLHFERVEPISLGIERGIGERLRILNPRRDFRELAFGEQLRVGLVASIFRGPQAEANDFSHHRDSATQYGERQNHFEQR